MAGSRHARHGASGSRHGGGSGGVGRGAVGVGAGTLVLLAAIFAGGLLVGRTGAPPAADATGTTAGDGASAVPAASAGGTTRPTMLAEVTRVVTGDELVVRVGTTEVPVRVLGLDTPDPETGDDSTGECGGREALAYADRTLSGQTVTLVPDPTLPEFDDDGRRLSYVVLRSQLSYTDGALMDGIGRADTSRPLWYADVFAREQERATEAGVGIWGRPCEARP